MFNPLILSFEIKKSNYFMEFLFCLPCSFIWKRGTSGTEAVSHFKIHDTPLMEGIWIAWTLAHAYYILIEAHLHMVEMECAFCVGVMIKDILQTLYLGAMELIDPSINMVGASSAFWHVCFGTHRHDIWANLACMWVFREVYIYHTPKGL